MDKVLINLNSLEVINYNSEVKPFQFAVNIPSLDNISKILKKEIKTHKVNSLGEKMYNVIIDNKEFEVTEYEINGKEASPIIITNVEEKIINFKDSPFEFNLDDIINNKKDQLLKNTDFKNCMLFEVNLQDVLDLSNKYHEADTGYKLIRLHPNGCVNFKPIKFESKISDFKLVFESLLPLNVEYSCNNKDFYSISNIDNLSTDILYLRITNENDQFNDIKSFHILYK